MLRSKRASARTGDTWYQVRQGIAVLGTDVLVEQGDGVAMLSKGGSRCCAPVAAGHVSQIACGAAGSGDGSVRIWSSGSGAQVRGG